MQLNSKQKLVLVALLRNQRQLASMDHTAADSLPTMQRGQYRLAIIRAREGAVPIDLNAWLGYQPTTSQRVMFNREFDRLERFGLIRRVNFYGGRRASHLRLTEIGVREAARLLAEEQALASEMPPGESDDVADLPAPISLDAIDWSSLGVPPEAPADQPA
jgi:DNA-binding MarR family transcriptional regulator